MANEDGTIAIGNTNVFDGTTFQVRSALPVASTTMAISADYATLYLYELNTSRISVHPLAP